MTTTPTTRTRRTAALALLTCAALLAPAAAAEAPLELTRGKLTVKANLNTEVFYTILNLAASSAELRNTVYMPVYADMAAYFAPHKGHPAVKELDADGALNWSTGFAYNVPAEFPLYFSDLPEGRKIADYTAEFLNRLNIQGVSPGDHDAKTAYMDAYWEKVKDFHKASSFAGYWEKMRGRYAGFAADLYAALPRADLVGMQEAYHGYSSFDGAVMIASPLTLTSGGNYGLTVRDRDGAATIYSILSAARRPGGGSDFKSAVNAEQMALHEFGHPFCNPVVARHYAAARRYAFLRAGLRGKVDAAYGDWRSVMNELLVRAVHARLLLKLRGEAAAADFLKAESERAGFIFIEDWYRLLGGYEADRAKYPTLDEFYPRLLAALATWGVHERQEPRPLGAKWVKAVPGGVQIVKAEADGAAYAAGLRNGDTVTAVDGAPIATPDAYLYFSKAFDALPAGKAMTFTVLRSSGSAEVKVERSLGGFLRVVRLGGEYKNVTRLTPSEPGLFWAGFGPEGMTVGFATDDKPAYRAGIRKGDVIKSAGGAPLTSREAYERALADWNRLPQGGVMKFTILRGGRETDLDVKSDQWEELTETVRVAGPAKP